MSSKADNKLPIHKMTERGKLIITSQLQEQINYLHRKAGSTEWSGVLLNKREQGDLDEPDGFVMKGEHLFLLDIGSPGYTSETLESADVMDMYDAVPDAVEMRMGYIHSHHSMSAYFSGTDIEELQDNAPLYNYYLSLIVNFKGDYVAKVAYVAEVENKIYFKNVEDEEKEFTTEKYKILVLMDLDVETEGSLPSVSSKTVKRTGYERIKGQLRKVTWYSVEEEEVVQNETIQANILARMDKFLSEKKEKKSNHSTHYTGSHHYVPGRTESFSQRTFRDAMEEDEPLGRKELEGPLARRLLIAWLNEGSSFNKKTLTRRPFESVSEGLTFFESVFNDDAYTDFDLSAYGNFLMAMQQHLFELTIDYQPSAIVRCLSTELQFWKGAFNIADDLRTLVQAHPRNCSETKKKMGIENQTSLWPTEEQVSSAYDRYKRNGFGDGYDD